MKLILGDSKIKLKDLPENSVDSIVTDPPYGLSSPKNGGKKSTGGFMGKKWDYDVPSVELWKEVHRVLKPGGFLLSFGGSRTYHRMVVNIEDAGFEIRDQIMWIYGSGFPKSHNIGKAVDKLEGNDRDVIENKYKSRNPNGKYGTGLSGNNNIQVRNIDTETKGTSDWEGWGTALKPAHEPIVMARKPLSENTVALNVLKWGTGGINIDESRVVTNEEITNHSRSSESAISKGKYGDSSEQETHQTPGQSIGRFPANLILDEEAGIMLDTQSGISKSTGGTGLKSMGALGNSVYGKYKNDTLATNAGGMGDTGGASRFFYCPKASKTDRNEGLDDFEDKLAPKRDDGQPYGMNTNKFRPDGSERNEVQPKKNNHPTVKPTELMKYLVKMVTQKGGTVLDPFMGSGSTGKACKQLGYDFIGIELDEDYMKIAKGRIENTTLDGETYIEPKQKENINKFFDL